MTWLGLAPGTGPVRPPVSWDSGAITANAPVLTLSQEWNDGAEAFTAFRINVTPTAYAAGSRFLALENSGTAKFVVDGGVGGNYVGLRHPSGEEINIGIIGGSAYGGAITLDRVQAVTTLYTSGGVSFGTINYGARDTGLYRTSAGLLEVNSGTLGAYRDLYVRTLNANTSLILGGSTNKVIYPGTFNGEVGIGNAGGNFFYFNGNTKAIGVYPTGGMRWAASAAVLTGNTTYDTGITRTSAGVLEINSGTASAYRDLTLRSLFAVGGTITASAPGISVTQTWNNGSETFNAFTLAIQRTANATSSSIVKASVDGTTTFSYDLTDNGRLYLRCAPPHAQTLTISPRAGTNVAVIEFSTASAVSFSPGGISLTPQSGNRNRAMPMCLTAENVMEFRPNEDSSTEPSWHFFNTRSDASNYEKFSVVTNPGETELIASSAGTGTADIDLRLTPAGTGAVYTAAPINIESGSLTSNKTGFSLTQTWDNGSESFTAFKVNATATAAASTSYAAEFQVGGTTYLSVRKDGYVTLGSLSGHHLFVEAYRITNYFGTALRGRVSLADSVTLTPSSGNDVNLFLTDNSGLYLGSYTQGVTYNIGALGFGAANGNGSNLVIHGGAAATTADTVGGTLTLRGGAGLGAGAPGYVRIETTIAGASGTTLQSTYQTLFEADGTGIGFYGATPVAQQTGVPVTASDIHAALVALGLITA